MSENSIPLTRLCTKCHLELPLTIEYFHRSQKGTYGFVSACKDCIRKQSGHKKNIVTKDGMRECSKCHNVFPFTIEFFNSSDRAKSGLRSNCRECDRKRHKRWYEENREYAIASVSEWSKHNPDKKAISNTKWAKKHPERIRIIKNNYVNRHPERVRKSKSDYDKRNPENRLARTRNRRAMLRGAEGIHTQEDVLKQYALQEGRCYYCNVEVGNKYHVDHFHPIAKGGSNWPDNIVISCKACNLKKGDKLPEEWIIELLGLTED